MICLLWTMVWVSFPRMGCTLDQIWPIVWSAVRSINCVVCTHVHYWSELYSMIQLSHKVWDIIKQSGLMWWIIGNNDAGLVRLRPGELLCWIEREGVRGTTYDPPHSSLSFGTLSTARYMLLTSTEILAYCHLLYHQTKCLVIINVLLWF